MRTVIAHEMVEVHDTCLASVPETLSQGWASRRADRILAAALSASEIGRLHSYSLVVLAVLNHRGPGPRHDETKHPR